jgi:hypothetical protein
VEPLVPPVLLVDPLVLVDPPPVLVWAPVLASPVLVWAPVVASPVVASPVVSGGGRGTHWPLSKLQEWVSALQPG